MSDIAQTLQDRGNRYGDFANHASVTQDIKAAMQRHIRHDGEKGWAQLNDMHREALEMIAHKIGRILNGDPNYADSWHDIAGYAKLVEERLPNE